MPYINGELFEKGRECIHCKEPGVFKVKDGYVCEKCYEEHGHQEEEST